MISDEDLDKALDRIARTADGELLYRFCQRKLMEALADHSPKQGALRVAHGERRFAQLLMAKMAKGIDESGGRTDSSSRASERTVVFKRGAEPIRPGRHVSFRDAARGNDPEYLRLAAGDDGSSGA